jgi:hypothetical protein
VHAALSGVGGRAVRGRRLVNQALLHNGAVHGETVWRGSRGCRGGGGGDESFENSVLSYD